MSIFVNLFMTKWEKKTGVVAKIVIQEINPDTQENPTGMKSYSIYGRLCIRQSTHS